MLTILYLYYKEYWHIIFVYNTLDSFLLGYYWIYEINEEVFCLKTIKTGLVYIFRVLFFLLLTYSFHALNSVLYPTSHFSCFSAVVPDLLMSLCYMHIRHFFLIANYDLGL